MTIKVTHLLWVYSKTIRKNVIEMIFFSHYEPSACCGFFLYLTTIYCGTRPF